jgi:pyruvate kinase
VTGESAGGSFPLQAVEVMGNICIEAESVLNYEVTFQTLRAQVLARGASTCSDAAPIAMLHVSRCSLCRNGR